MAAAGGIVDPEWDKNGNDDEFVICPPCQRGYESNKEKVLSQLVSVREELKKARTELKRVGGDTALLVWLADHPQCTITADPNNKTDDNVDFPWWWKVWEEIGVGTIDGVDVGGAYRHETWGEGKTPREAIDNAIRGEQIRRRQDG